MTKQSFGKEKAFFLVRSKECNSEIKTRALQKGELSEVPAKRLKKCGLRVAANGVRFHSAALYGFLESRQSSHMGFESINLSRSQRNHGFRMFSQSSK